MKKLAGKEEQLLTDAKGKCTAVVLDLETYQRFRKATEKLADIPAYDTLRDRARAATTAGQSATLATYRANRKRSAK